jgi:hypothetical protein
MSDNKEPLTKNVDNGGDWLDKFVIFCKGNKSSFGPFESSGMECFLNGFMRVFLVGWGTWFTGWFTFFSPTRLYLLATTYLIKMAGSLATTAADSIIKVAKKQGVLKQLPMNNRLSMNNQLLH